MSRMNKHEAQSALKDINLKGFSRHSRVSLRTLNRLRAGQGDPTLGTLALLAADLEQFKSRIEEDLRILRAKLPAKDLP